MNVILQDFLLILALLIVAYPLGLYIKKVMDEENTFLSKVLAPLEKNIYKFLKIREDLDMNYKEYTLSVIMFSLVGLIVLFIMLKFDGMSSSLAFNTSASFITNTNWQSYAGELSLGMISQTMGLTVQNFVSASTGMAVLFALIRGIRNIRTSGLGNYFKDIIRITLYILIPLNIVVSLLLVAGGVMQTTNNNKVVSLIEPFAVDENHNVIYNSKIDLENNKVYLNNQEVKNATIIKEQLMPQGLMASQVAIKQTGTNGGGFTGTNSANPLENPNWITNMIEMMSIILIPAALCFTFGSALKKEKQGYLFLGVMSVCLVIVLVLITYSEFKTIPYMNNGINFLGLGNLEGKEARFGSGLSSLWTAITTSASSGSVNSMLDSYTPLGGMFAMLMIQLGEVIFGGVGSGLYGLVAFSIITVFIAGLMVGRTPEFLEKKIEPKEMKWAMIVALATPLSILLGSGIAALGFVDVSSIQSGPHGFSQLLYAFTSAGGNNGSAFAGFNANTTFLNISLALCMLFSRFTPIIGVLAFSGSLSVKKKNAVTSGTLQSDDFMFGFLLVFIILVIGALSFFPALSLGPIAEFLGRGI